MSSSKEQYRICVADRSYIGQIARFQVDMAKESEDTVLDPEEVRKGVAQVFDDEGKGCYVVAVDSNGEAVSSLMLTREWSDWHSTWYWWIESVYVQPSHRRNGVYSAMYSYVKEMARKRGVHSVRLYVDRTNEKGLSTYNSLGMHESHYLLYEEEL